ncbi:hypothetical protein LR48_Vigan08g050200 [Vigna angularis]|uniref:Uncharacterized protein n=1 Tax=Phaseolus angularis TaxID=3914 RepID=A0A0L9V3N2_PHAAN|nr:hypothetical protein LR48_Vigan08g050200 [Vigna angularis]
MVNYNCYIWGILEQRLIFKEKLLELGFTRENERGRGAPWLVLLTQKIEDEPEARMKEAELAEEKKRIKAIGRFKARLVSKVNKGHWIEEKREALKG